MSWKSLIGGYLLGTGLLLACHPIVPSDTCKQQMSRCLAKCNPDLDGREREQLPNAKVTSSSCERACMSCPGTSSTSSSTPGANTPTGAPDPLPPGAVSPPEGIDLNNPDDAGAPPRQPSPPYSE